MWFWRALRVLLEWPEPLKARFPFGAGLDDLHACDRMSKTARQSRTDLDAALSVARLYSADYFTDGETMTGAAWFGPFFAAEGKEGALIALEARYGLTASGIDEASEADTWREIVMQPFPVRPARGATGLLYGLRLDRLSSKAGAFTLVSAAAVSDRQTREAIPREGRRYRVFQGPPGGGPLEGAI